MAEKLLSVGLDVGTTSTQLIFSELTVENRASSFAVPELEIGERKILYKSPVHFTPLGEGNLVDAGALRQLITREYAAAGISRERVDTGAVIITGETSRRENARQVTQALADFAGDFVVATAGPDLESVLSAKGSGAVAFSRDTGKRVLHMDIGGGTSNLALIEDGKILRTGCLNVGGRLVKLDGAAVVTYVSPVLSGLCDLRVGEWASRQQLEELAQILAQALEMAAGLREPGELFTRLETREAEGSWQPPKEPCVISFSGGVADCIGKDHPHLAYGDLGPELGRAIRESRLCREEHMLGSETIRATVIGAGCHSAQLSGSTVFCQNVTFPLKNVPVVHITAEEQAGGLTEAIRQKLARQETRAVIAMPGMASPGYAQVASLAQAIAAAQQDRLLLCLERDMAKALGQALAVRLGREQSILCIDRVRIPEGSYLDVGAPIGPALPVVVKTLVLER